MVAQAVIGAGKQVRRRNHSAFIGSVTVVELDSVPDKARTPKEANGMSKKYLEVLGYHVSRPP